MNENTINQANKNIPLISVFKDIKLHSKPEEEEITIDDFLSKVKNGEWKLQIEKLRKYSQDEKKKDKYTILKSKLIYVTPNATFTTNRRLNCVKHLSGYAVIDIDGLTTPQLEYIRNYLKNCQYIYAVFVSPSEKGLKALLKVPKSKTNFKKYVLCFYELLQREFKHFNFKNKELDSGAAQDLTRACFVSYDIDLYINKTAIEWTKILKEKSYVSPSPSNSVKISTPSNYSSKLNSKQPMSKFIHWVYIQLRGTQFETDFFKHFDNDFHDIIKCHLISIRELSKDAENWADTIYHHYLTTDMASYRHDIKSGKWVYSNSKIEEGLKLHPVLWGLWLEWNKISNKELCYMIANKLLEDNSILTLLEDDDIFVYKEGIWETEGKKKLEIIMRELLGEKLTINLTNEILHHIKIKTYISIKNINPSNPKLVPFVNGVLNLENGRLGEYKKEYYFYSKFPVNYDKKSKCLQWLKFLDEVLDETSINLIQEIGGYCFVREHPIHKTFIFLGEGRNGKSTILKILELIFGDDNVVNIALDSIENHTFSNVEFHNKYINLSDDIGSADVHQSQFLKQITSESLISADRKFKKRLHFKSYCKQIFLSNQLPRFTDTSYGFESRIVLINFDKVYFTEAEIEAKKKSDSLPTNYGIIDIDLVSKLKTEIEGITNWFIEGYKRLHKNKSFTGAVINQENIHQKLLAGSSTGVKFIQENTIEGYVSTDDIFKIYFTEAYKNYCIEWKKNHFSTPETQIKFNENLRQTFAYDNLRTGAKRDGYALINRRWKDENTDTEPAIEEINALEDDLN